MTELIALITGANKGIGLETARQLGARGMTVLIGARDSARGGAAEAALRAEGIDAHHVELDITGAKSGAPVLNRHAAAEPYLHVIVRKPLHA